MTLRDSPPGPMSHILSQTPAQSLQPPAARPLKMGPPPKPLSLLLLARSPPDRPRLRPRPQRGPRSAPGAPPTHSVLCVTRARLHRLDA